MAWKTIADDKIRHIWADGEGEISIEPHWYAENGTPVDPETGEDMSYVRTEILAD